MEKVYIVSMAHNLCTVMKHAYASCDDAIAAAREQFKNNENVKLMAEPRHVASSVLWLGNQAWEIGSWNDGYSMGTVTVVELTVKS